MKKFHNKKTIIFIVEKDFYVFLKKIADELGITMSELIRDALYEKHVEKWFRKRYVG